MSWFKQEPVVVEVQGRALKCLVCGGDVFYQLEAQLITPGRSFLDLEWTSPTGTCNVCTKCGYIHWFLPP